MSKTHHVQFYGKEGCCLCQLVREWLYSLKDRFSIIIHEIDITTDGALYERYKAIIPVVTIDGQFTLETRIDKEDICRYLEERAEGFSE